MYIGERGRRQPASASRPAVRVAVVAGFQGNATRMLRTRRHSPPYDGLGLPPWWSLVSSARRLTDWGAEP
jgi:hypothetical protein